MALVSMTDSITSLPAEFKTAMEIVSLWTSIPIYLVLSIKRVLLSGGFEANTQNLLQRGALLYCVVLIGMYGPLQVPPCSGTSPCARIECPNAGTSIVLRAA